MNKLQFLYTGIIWRVGIVFILIISPLVIAALVLEKVEAKDDAYTAGYYFNIYMGDGLFQYYRVRFNNKIKTGDFCWFLDSYVNSDVYRGGFSEDTRWWENFGIEKVRHACFTFSTGSTPGSFSSSAPVEYLGGKYLFQFKGKLLKIQMMGELKIITLRKNEDGFVEVRRIKSNHYETISD